jgi:hypothetical protein
MVDRRVEGEVDGEDAQVIVVVKEEKDEGEDVPWRRFLY